MSSYMKIGFNVVGRMAAEHIIFLKNQDSTTSHCFWYLEYPPVDLNELQERKEALKEANDKLGSSLNEQWTVNKKSQPRILTIL